MILERKNFDYKNAKELEVLVKLLATEKISIEHRQVSNAYFDLRRRAVVLPMWAGLSKHIYHMLMCHEVGHGLYTPTLMWEEFIKKNPELKDVLNVFEDIRIERLFMKKYPGSTVNFKFGNDESFNLEKDSINLDSMSSIDKINYVAKKGPNTPDIKLSPFEQKFLDEAMKTESFEDVGALTLTYAESLHHKNDIDGLSLSEFLKKFAKILDMNKQKINQKDLKFTPNEEFQTEMDDHTAVEYTKKMKQDLTSKMLSNFNTNISRFVDRNAASPDYINIPSIKDWNSYVIPYDSLYGKDIFKDKIQGYNKFIIKHNQYIQQLVKKFEKKKAALSFMRAKENKTGKLDVSKLHNYKFNDDLFLSNIEIPHIKSHGMVFLLDISSSMSGNIQKTVEQLIILSTFCLKTKIPFEVYAFSDSHPTERVRHRAKNYKHSSFTRDLSIHTSHAIDNRQDLTLYNILSHKMDKKHFESSCGILLHTFSTRVNDRVQYNINDMSAAAILQDVGISLMLCGTPLNSSLVVVRNLITNFKNANKLSVVNFMVLTDGDSAHLPIKSFEEKVHLESTYKPRHSWIYIDSQTGKRYIQKDYVNFTHVMYNIISDSGINVINFLISDKSTLRRYMKSISLFLKGKKREKNIDNRVEKEFDNDGYTCVEGFGSINLQIFMKLNIKNFYEAHMQSAKEEKKVTTLRNIAKTFALKVNQTYNSKIMTNKFIEVITKNM